MEKDKYVVCPNWPRYRINCYGEILTKNNKKRIPYKTTTGYLYIVMRDAGVRKACAVHRLVAEAFIGNAPSGHEHVAHYDGNKLNNYYNNLRYVNRSENENDKVRHGRSNRGENMGRSILKVCQVMDIKEKLKKGVRAKELSVVHGVACSTIRSIKQGKSWSWLECNS